MANQVICTSNWKSGLTPWFERDGPDLIMALPLGFPSKCLEPKLSCLILMASRWSLTFPLVPTSKADCSGRGMPYRRGRGRGDVTVLLKLAPEKISKSMRSVLEDLRADFGLPMEDIESMVRREAEERRG